MSEEAEVARHYGRPGLAQRIREALVAAGKDLDRLAPGDLAAIDEFHLGWRPATLTFAEALGIGPGLRVLDIGAGLGGPARHFAERGALVEGIDITPEFVATASALTDLSGLSGRVAFREGSGIAMPFEDARFAVATLIHVGMNIADKAALFAEAARVLRPGGRFGVYDIMRTGEGDVPYPMPWADGPATSFLERPGTYRALLETSGFRVVSERDRTDFALETAESLMPRNGEGAAGAILGLHLVIGPDARARVGALLGCLRTGDLAPVEIVAERG